MILIQPVNDFEDSKSILSFMIHISAFTTLDFILHNLTILKQIEIRGYLFKTKALMVYWGYKKMSCILFQALIALDML